MHKSIDIKDHNKFSLNQGAGPRLMAVLDVKFEELIDRSFLLRLENFKRQIFRCRLPPLNRNVVRFSLSLQVIMADGGFVVYVQ